MPSCTVFLNVMFRFLLICLCCNKYRILLTPLYGDLDLSWLNKCWLSLLWLPLFELQVCFGVLTVTEILWLPIKLLIIIIYISWDNWESHVSQCTMKQLNWMLKLCNVYIPQSLIALMQHIQNAIMHIVLAFAWWPYWSGFIRSCSDCCMKFKVGMLMHKAHIRTHSCHTSVEPCHWSVAKGHHAIATAWFHKHEPMLVICFLCSWSYHLLQPSQ